MRSSAARVSGRRQSPSATNNGRVTTDSSLSDVVRLSTLDIRLMQIDGTLLPPCESVTDLSPWEWYHGDCRCGLPAGECREHPRARGSQRPPGGSRRGG